MPKGKPKTRLVNQETKPESQPVSVIRANPEALRVAKKIAPNLKLVANPDGSVTITNESLDGD